MSRPFCSVPSRLASIRPQLQALDSTRRISQYAHTAWRLQDGILSGVPTTITQSSDGYLWVGTQGALFRFDGIRFVPWTPPANQNLPSENILSLAPAREGETVGGTGTGLARWTGQRAQLASRRLPASTRSLLIAMETRGLL